MLFDRLRFTGEHRLLHTQIDRFDHTAVGGDGAAGFQQDDIAGDQIARRRLLDMTAAANAHVGDGHFLQGGHGLFGAVFLSEAEDGIEYDDDQDDDGVFIFA